MNLMNYEYKTKPYEHQVKTLEQSCDKPAHALFLEMGLGKSKILIDNIGMLFLDKKITGAVVVAPKGVLDNWSINEIDRHLPDTIERNVLVWQSNHTQQWTKDFKSMVEEDSTGKLNFLLINVEALATDKGAKHLQEFLATHDCMLAIDESTTIKNPKAKRTKNLVKLAPMAKYRRILTGFPITKAPLDLYSQCYFLHPELLGYNSYYAFRARYAITQRRQMGGHAFDHIVGYQRLDELQESIKYFSTRYKKEDCLDLPEKLYIKRYVELTTEQKKAYEQMKKEAIMILEEETFTTVNVLTQLMRLQQVVAGSLRGPDGNIIKLKNNRLQSVLDVIEETQGKVVIFGVFHTDIETLAEALQSKYGKNSTATYYGNTPQSERQNIITRFQDPDSELKYFISNPMTGGRGITLTEANVIIYYSNSYDLELRIQSEDRIHRIGQDNKCTYVDLVSPDTVDEHILKTLLNKVKISNEILGEVRQWFD